MNRRIIFLKENDNLKEQMPDDVLFNLTCAKDPRGGDRFNVTVQCITDVNQKIGYDAVVMATGSCNNAMRAAIDHLIKLDYFKGYNHRLV